jgi:hypothetical protein
VRAYISRAVELNPDNIEAKQAQEIHNKPVHVIYVSTSTNVVTTAIARASSSSSSLSSIR